MSDHIIGMLVVHTEVCPNQILELSGGDVAAIVDYITELQNKIAHYELEAGRKMTARSRERARRARETPEETAERRRKNRERMRAKRNGTRI